MTRWRMVTRQNGIEYVSSIVMTEEEIHQHLRAEAEMHRAAGWTVTEGVNVVVAHRGGKERVMVGREYDAMDDKPTGEAA